MTIGEYVKKPTEMEQVSSFSTGSGALLGKQLVKSGKLTEGDVLRIIDVQRMNNLRFGEAAVTLGLLKSHDIEEVLAAQFDYPYPSEGNSEFSPLLVAANQPYGVQSEALRALRIHLMVGWLKANQQCLAVTSCRGGEGASSIAANLAIVFAQMGERTLLIDANFRRPVQHLLFGLKPLAGLSSLLNGRCSINDTLTGVPPFRFLSVICAGAPPPNPQELLGRVTFSYLLETAPAAFDIVIIDTAPILDYADAQIVSSRASGCLLVTRRNESRLSDVRRVTSVLAVSQTKLVGTVVNE